MFKKGKWQTTEQEETTGEGLMQLVISLSIKELERWVSGMVMDLLL